MSTHNILHRARTIRLSLVDLARLSGVNKHTLSKLARTRARGPVEATLRKADAALASEERRLRDHLNTLHPVEKDKDAA